MLPLRFERVHGRISVNIVFEKSLVFRSLNSIVIPTIALVSSVFFRFYQYSALLTMWHLFGKVAFRLSFMKTNLFYF